MSNNKQSSVEWFLNELIKEGYIKRLPVTQLQQAKAMHREEHGKTWDDSLDNLKARGMNEMRAYTDFDDYYAEKFRVNDEQAMIDYNKMEEEWEMDNYNEMKDEEHS